jgi:hypothetical protein
VIRAVAIVSLLTTLALALYLPSAFPPERFLAQLKADHQAASELWGPDDATRLLESALTITQVPDGPGMRSTAGSAVDTAVSREMATVGQRLFHNAYFRSIEALLLLAMFRLAAIAHALPWLLPFVATVLVDAQLVRLRKSREFHRHDPELFALALTGAIVVACCTFVTLLLPIDVPSVMWSVAPLLSGWLLGEALASFHHRF